MSGLQSSQTSHFDAIYTLLPSTLKAGIDDLLCRATRESAVKHTLDQLVRFSLGRDATDEDTDSREEWNAQRHKAGEALSILDGGHQGKKRSRDSDENDSATNPKRQKIETSNVDDDDDPVFTLHSVSVSSPIRKKVNITIYKDTIGFTHPTSGVKETSRPLHSLSRAFLISTPGKTKPHWTVIILTGSDQSQIIFGLDAVPPSISATVHPNPPQINPKGTEAKPILTQFFSFLPPHVKFQEPSIQQFRSSAGEVYLDAYLRAKDGHLFFFEDGLLFGEKKPCMWIAMDQIESVRSLSATGRTFSLFVTRVADASQGEDPGDGEETEFSLIDGKNQDAVALWVKNNRPRFGVETKLRNSMKGSDGEDELADEGREGVKAKEDSEDLEDSDFEDASESDGGSATSQSSDDEADEGGAEAEADSEGGEDEDEDEDEDEGAELSPSKHPLLRPGAMPKMSKAAMDAVVGMVEADLMDTSGGKAGGDEEDELDELED